MRLIRIPGILGITTLHLFTTFVSASGLVLLQILNSQFLILNCSSSASAESSQYFLYRSEDQAKSWSQSDLGLSRNSRINTLAASAQTFLAGTDAGVFISTNAAKSWQPVAETKSKRVTSLTTFDHHAFAGTMDGLLTSSDRGFTWQRNPSFPKQAIIRSLHALDGSIFVGTDAHHVYQSSDRGQTWAHLTAGLPPLSQVLALASLNGRLFAGLYARGLYTWDTTQKKWLQLGSSQKIAPLDLATNDGTLIAGHNPGGIFSSDDLGQTWRHWSLSSEAKSQGSEFPTFDSRSSSGSDSVSGILNSQFLILNSHPLPALEAPIWEMAANSKIALAGAGDGIYYSTDRARTWTRATTGLPVQSSGIAFLLHENLILAATHQKSIAECSSPAIKK